MNFKELQERLEQGDKMAPQELRDKVCQSSEEEVRDWVRGTLPLWETSSEVWDFDDAPEEGLFASKIGNLVWNALMEESKKPLIAYALGLMCWKGARLYADENGIEEGFRYIRWCEEAYNHFEDAEGIADARYLMGEQSEGDIYAQARYYGEAAMLGHKYAFDELWAICDLYEDNDEVQSSMADVLTNGPEEVVSWFRARAERGSEEALKFLKVMWDGKDDGDGNYSYNSALYCLVGMADAGNTRAQEVLEETDWERRGEYFEWSDAIRYLRKAADSGSEWGKKTYNSLITFLLDSGDEWDVLSEDVAADGDLEMLLAAWKGDTEAVRLFLDKGADVQAKTEGGKTALMLAAWNGHTEAVRLLLDKGADVQAQDKNGRTALMYAVWNGHPEAVRLLLDKGADVQAKEDDGWTALMYAVWNGHPEAVRLLLDKGADVQAKITGGWRNGKTALDLADNEEIRALLRAAGAEG